MAAYAGRLSVLIAAGGEDALGGEIPFGDGRGARCDRCDKSHLCPPANTFASAQVTVPLQLEQDALHRFIHADV